MPPNRQSREVLLTTDGYTMYKSLIAQALDCGRNTLANSGGGLFSSKVENLDSACIAIESHIALCLAAHAVCPGCE